MKASEKHERELRECIDMLIDIRNFDIKLTPYATLTSLMILSEDVYSQFDCIAETKESDTYSYLLAIYLRTGSKEDGKNLLDAMVKGATSYYKPKINKLIEQARENFEADRIDGIPRMSDEEHYGRVSTI